MTEISDGFTSMETCEHPKCDLQVVRPGKFQCSEYCDALSFQRETENILRPNAYGMCIVCGYRVGVACICNMTFAEKIKTVGVDYEALRRMHRTTE